MNWLTSISLWRTHKIGESRKAPNTSGAENGGSKELPGSFQLPESVVAINTTDTSLNYRHTARPTWNELEQFGHFP
jgi:hypothetical protein